MFRATHRPSSGAQNTLIAASDFTYFLVDDRCNGWAIAAAENQQSM